MAGCFPDFRGRASSFDLHSLEEGQKMSILNRLFRSKSDSGLKIGRRSPSDSPSSSPRVSPRASPGAPPRRRFVRVVRDSEAEGEEYVNRHVIRKYNKGYTPEQHNMRKCASLDNADRPLPYKVTGPTILKKHRSLEADASGSHKHTCFKEEIEIVEFDTKEKCAFIMNEACIMHQRLQDDTMEECLATDLSKSRDISPSRDSSSDSEQDEVYHIVTTLDLSLGVIDELKNGEHSTENTPDTENPKSKESPLYCTHNKSDSESQSENEKRPPPERQSSSESEDEGRSAPKKSKFGEKEATEAKADEAADKLTKMDHSLLKVES